MTEVIPGVIPETVLEGIPRKIHGIFGNRVGAIPEEFQERVS